MMESIDKLLPKNILKAGAGRQIKAAIILERTDEVLGGLFGEDAAKRMKAVTFKDGTVTVRCEDSVHAQEVALNEREILSGLTEALGERAVERLRVTS